jgi:hypothetical protein
MVRILHFLGVEFAEASSIYYSMGDLQDSTITRGNAWDIRSSGASNLDSLYCLPYGKQSLVSRSSPVSRHNNLVQVYALKKL